MASKAVGLARTESAVAFHWSTYFAHVHGRLPRPVGAQDRAALREIVRVQAMGRGGLALSEIEYIVRAPIEGDSLAARYVAYWAHLEAHKLTRSIARDIRGCIVAAAERAA